jgi:hypothetical protein
MSSFSQSNVAVYLCCLTCSEAAGLMDPNCTIGRMEWPQHNDSLTTLLQHCPVGKTKIPTLYDYRVLFTKDNILNSDNW